MRNTPIRRSTKPIRRESEKHRLKRLAEQSKPVSERSRKGFSTIPAPRKPVKKRNAKRAASAFAEAYHSRARKAFVRSLACVFCTMLSPVFAFVTAGKCDNAHTGEKPGKGLKSHYTTIVPLCRTHHRMYDDREKMFGTPEVRAAIEALAPEVESRWRAHVGESA